MTLSACLVCVCRQIWQWDMEHSNTQTHTYTTTFIQYCVARHVSILNRYILLQFNKRIVE